MAETEVNDSPDLLMDQGEDVVEEGDHQMQDAQKPNNDSELESASSTDSESDSEGEDQIKIEIETLEAELSNNISNYDVHVQYIRALRKKGDDFEKLKQSREVMSVMFPLSPDLWREWARDETAVDSSPEALRYIENLYELGVSDYLSVALWLDYINFLQEYDPSIRECSDNGVSKMRDIFERAVTAAGLHVAEGGNIFEAYREFEQAIFLTLSEADAESREKQAQRIRSIFFRQLSVPLLVLEQTLVTYKAWEAEQGSNANVDADPSSSNGLPVHVASAYQKALEMLKARNHFEEAITKKDDLDAERLTQFMTYLKFEKSSGDPARVQVLYERAITEFPICTDLWLDYTFYLDKTIKTSSIVRNVYSRSIRNCPWVGELWTRYLLYLERVHASDQEVSEVFEKSLQCTFSSYDEYLDLFLTRVDGLRRRISSNVKIEGADALSLIRETFQRAIDYLAASLKNTESLLRLYRYWANLELSLGNDKNAARAVWESLLKISGSMLEAWQGYIDMEIRAGHLTEARSLYKRCYSKRFSSTGSEDICHSWLRFEREYGSLEDLDLAVHKVEPRMEELKLFRMHQESKASGVNDVQENSAKKNVREKRKSQSNISDDVPPAKRAKDASVKKPKKTKQKGKNQTTESGGNNVAIEGQAKKGSSGGGGSKKDTEGSMAAGKNKQYNDQCTAFVSNLSLQANYETLRSFFSDVGGVVGIRILNDKFTGKSRGLAYVDFTDEEHLAAALAKNKKNLLGKKLSVLKSDPKGKRKRAEQSTLPKPGDAASNEASKTEQSPKQSNVEDNIKLKGRPAFLPRAVIPLGGTNKSKPRVVPTPQAEEDEKPKSNDDFKNMLLKKT